MNISMWDGWFEVCGHVGNLFSGLWNWTNRMVLVSSDGKKNMTVMALFGFVGWFYEINGLPHIPIVSHYIPYPVIYRYISLYPVIYRYISLYIVIYRYLSLYIVIYRYISLSIVIYHYISLYIVIFQCHEKSSTDHVHDMRIRSNIWGFLHRRAPSDQSSPYFGQNPPLLVEPCRCPVGFAQRNWQRLNRYEQINGTCRWLISDNLSILDENPKRLFDWEATIKKYWINMSIAVPP
jgi:hypothetical protein